jgi:hypothetical protein
VSKVVLLMNDSTSTSATERSVSVYTRLGRISLSVDCMRSDGYCTCCTLQRMVGVSSWALQ